MSEERPKPRRKTPKDPYTACENSILVRFTLKALPPDPTRERKGRPARSPSLPPDEPKPGEQTPPPG